MKIIENLLPKVKANLIIEHTDDDEFLCNLIRAALDYAKNYQNKKSLKNLSPTTKQAVIMLAGFWYESRDGGSGGFMTNAKGDEIMRAVNWLLSLDKEYQI
jgi:hypothetical protein